MATPFFEFKESPLENGNKKCIYRKWLYRWQISENMYDFKNFCENTLIEKAIYG